MANLYIDFNRVRGGITKSAKYVSWRESKECVNLELLLKVRVVILRIIELMQEPRQENRSLKIRTSDDGFILKEVERRISYLRILYLDKWW